MARQTPQAPWLRPVLSDPLTAPMRPGTWGSTKGTLGNWVNADRRRQSGGNGELSEDERAELSRLRRENAELAMRCDVLKRSVALWVQDAMGSR
jgi:transposase